MDLYRENLLDHYKNPRNFGKPDNWLTEYRWEEFNPSCGDKIGIAVKVRTGKNRNKGEVTDIRFWGEGCVVSMASASLLTEEVRKRKSITSIRELTPEDVFKMLGGKETIPPARFRCALLSLESLKRAMGTWAK
jgi:nitrogen fixation NifU-like protein